MHRQVIRWSMRLVLHVACPAVALFIAGCPGAPGGGGSGSGSGGNGNENGEPPSPQTTPIQVIEVGQGTVEQDVEGTTITLTALPAAGWVFDRWTGANIPNPQDNPLSVEMDDDITSITATFVDDDADADGVPNGQDTCPNSPAGEQVDAAGCAISERDTDGDGVNDDVDKCLTTPVGTNVDADGCPESVDATLDADGDGVPDDIDSCAGTPAGTTVDANGCVDTDGDGIADTVDDCAGTPTGAVVDVNGCSNDEADSDNDGISNNIDDCPNTPQDKNVNDVGCADSQLDSDDDGVMDDVDDCPATPRGEDVDPTTGCPPSGGGGGGGGGNSPVCGNGAVETGETCDDGNTDPGDGCDENCQTEPGGAECGNGIIDAGETCDDNNTDPGDGCDENCQAEVLANDSCAHPTSVGTETISFSNVGATTDGPDEPGPCALLDVTQIDADVWFIFASPCTDDIVVSVCGASFDTKLAIYGGSACPPGESIRCSDDDCGPGQGSRLQFPAQAGESYLIRVGGFQGVQGTSTMTISCASDSSVGVGTCGNAPNACEDTSEAPGCEDSECCLTTCAVDPFCCDTEWDSVCVEKARDVICRDTPPVVCDAGTGDCNDVLGNGSPGCEDTDCCKKVCLQDPYCCLTEWDDICALTAGSVCGFAEVCETATGDCHTDQTEQGTAGCNVNLCCNLVCSADHACCNTLWDDLCAEQADAICPD